MAAIHGDLHFMFLAPPDNQRSDAVSAIPLEFPPKNIDLYLEEKLTVDLWSC